MVSIPTPIPESVVTNARDFFSGRVADVLWRSLLLVIGAALVYLIVASPMAGFFVLFLVGAVLSILFEDDIRQVVRDIWNRNFWVWRV